MITPKLFCILGKKIFFLRLFYSNPNLTYSYLFRIKKEREEKDKKEKKKPLVSSASSAAPKMAGEGNIKV